MSYYRYASPNYYRPSLFGGFRFFPPVIKTLLISNVVLFLLSSFFGMFRIGSIHLIAVINSVFALYPLGEGFQVWQLLTYLFMHGSLMHLLFNMLALWMFGMDLENTWGSRKFLLYYLVCGIGAGISNLFIGPLFGPTAPTVGASGAIYGVLLAFGLMYPDRPIFVYFLLPIRARYFVIFYIVVELYAGVTGSADGIAHFAHLGGAAAGLIFLLFDWDTIPLRKWWYEWKAGATRPPRLGNTAYRDRYKTRGEISEARYYDVQGRDEDDDDEVSQERIDEILDKISKHGYQSLSEDEKRILFEASKKLN